MYPESLDTCSRDSCDKRPQCNPCMNSRMLYKKMEDKLKSDLYVDNHKLFETYGQFSIQIAPLGVWRGVMTQSQKMH